MMNRVVRPALIFFVYATSAAACSGKSRDASADAQKDSAAIAQARANPVTAPSVPVDSGVADTSSHASTSASAAASVAQTLPAASTSASGKVASPSDADAKILTRMADKYKTVQSMRADFTMRVQNALLRTTSNSNGKLYQKRPDKIALRFAKPAGDIVLSDGTYFWVYMPSSFSKDQVVRTPVASAGAGGLDLRQVDLQQQFVGDPVKRFRYTHEGSESVDGRIADIFTLVPRETAQYQKLKVWIDRNDSLVRRFEVTEKSGVARLVQLNNLAINVPVDASVFHYSPPAGVRIVGQ